MARGLQRLKGDASITLTQLIGNFIMALVIASIFYNLPSDTSSFYSRGALLFFGLLLNSFASALEVNSVLRNVFAPLLIWSRS
jgi:ATP-binding cassette, subfamily G (WHITE), member 2, PDR